MAVRSSTRKLLAGAFLFATAALNAVAQSKSQGAPPPAVLPDVVGIRPGMSAQEAYDLLKKRAAGAQIGVGESRDDRSGHGRPGHDHANQAQPCCSSHLRVYPLN